MARLSARDVCSAEESSRDGARLDRQCARASQYSSRRPSHRAPSSGPAALRAWPWVDDGLPLDDILQMDNIPVGQGTGQTGAGVDGSGRVWHRSGADRAHSDHVAHVAWRSPPIHLINVLGAVGGSIPDLSRWAGVSGPA